MYIHTVIVVDLSQFINISGAHLVYTTAYGNTRDITPMQINMRCSDVIELNMKLRRHVGGIPNVKSMS